MRMHHIGIIVKKIEASQPLYQALGYLPQGELCEDKIQNNRLLFMENSLSGEVIELIEPLNQNSSVANLKPGLAHICYEVTGDFDAFIEDFRGLKIGTVFTEKIPAPAFGGRRVAFALLKDKSMVEFVEMKAESQP